MQVVRPGGRTPGRLAKVVLEAGDSIVAWDPEPAVPVWIHDEWPTDPYSPLPRPCPCGIPDLGRGRTLELTPVMCQPVESWNGNWGQKLGCYRKRSQWNFLHTRLWLESHACDNHGCATATSWPDLTALSDIHNVNKVAYYHRSLKTG